MESSEADSEWCMEAVLMDFRAVVYVLVAIAVVLLIILLAQRVF
jgi:preprotein translocase subunit Sec61beta